MKRQAALDLDQFPDSLYARELHRGFPDLRFTPDLERDYQAFHLDRVRIRVRFFQLAILALLVAIVLHLLLLDHVPIREAVYSWVGLAIPLCVVLVGVSFSSWYVPLYLPAARVALPVLGVAAAIGIADRTIFGHADAFYFLTSYSFALFFLGGLLFHEALLASALLVITHGAALAYVHQPLPEVYYYIAVLTITAMIGAFVYRGMEHQLRTTFLEQGLMSELAARDGLTGLKNRGAFDSHLPRMWGQAMRDRRNLAIILIDVDHFKAYNDRYGHQAGDKALRRVAQVVQGFARRPLDMAARYGGEEFVLALFDLASEHVHDIAEQLRQAVQALQIPHEESAAAPVVTTSVGVSLVGPRHGRSAAGALQLADEALYSAKRHGRNCVRFAELDPSFATGIFRRRTMPPRNPPRRSAG
jgi:diguanylate cyclase (GGDEF)-like protein